MYNDKLVEVQKLREGRKALKHLDSMVLFGGCKGLMPQDSD